MTAPAAERGRTTIANRVLERIATRTLAEVGPAGGVARWSLGVPLRRGRPAGAPRVTAQVDGSLATLQMTISVAYPTPIRQVTNELRERVSGRVSELTGLTVRQVDIAIADLTTTPSSRVR